MSKQYLVMGLPSTGKTTYLAGFWIVAESESIPTSLRLAELFKDREYISGIADSWISFKKLGRNIVGSQKRVVMLLTGQGMSEAVDVTFPDLSGEEFELMLSQRSWTQEYSEIAQNASGVLLFVHPSQIEKPISIDAINSIVEQITPVADGGIENSDNKAATEMKFDERKIPTQVKLVELLQLHRSRSWGDKRLKLAIMVSAWDLIESTHITPKNWLERALPLLDQYLSSNFEWFEVQVFGVSAQGGDLVKDIERLQKLKAHERVRIVGEKLDSNDITEPVRWLLT